MYEHLQKSLIDNKEQILEALVTQDWKITAINIFSGVNCGDPVINLKSDKGYWKNLILLNLFSKVVLVEELIAINKKQ